MPVAREEDDVLRVRAVEVLGPLGDTLAREVLEQGLAHAARDGLAAALAAAMAERAGHTIVDVVLAPSRVERSRGGSPYRNPRAGRS